MPAAILNLICDQGASFNLLLEITEDNDSPRDLTGCTAHMQVRTSPGGTLIADLTEANGGIIIDGPEGTIRLTQTHTQTNAYNTAGLTEGWVRTEDERRYGPIAYYDLEITDDSGTVTRWLQGEFLISPQVTV